VIEFSSGIVGRVVRVSSDLLGLGILWRLAAGCLLACVAFACSNFSTDPYKDVHKATAELQAAERQGLTFEDFRDLRQELAAQVQLAAEAAGDAPKGSVNWNKFSCYEMALAVDKTATDTWETFLKTDEITQIVKDQEYLKESDQVECGAKKDALDQVIKDFQIPVRSVRGYRTDTFHCVYLNEVLAPSGASRTNTLLRQLWEKVAPDIDHMGPYIDVSINPSM
jgi:hypothetical protein